MNDLGLANKIVPPFLDVGCIIFFAQKLKNTRGGKTTHVLVGITAG
jgi:hypothetical protein